MRDKGRRAAAGAAIGLLVGTFFCGSAAAVPTGQQTPRDVVFAEDFESGNLDQWGVQACPDGVSLSTEQARDGQTSAKFTVSDDDTGENCEDVPTENPRAQLVSDGLFDEGDERYIAFSTYFPADFPTPESWFQIAEFYGPPFGGSPTMGIDLCGDRVCFSRDESNNYDTIWEMDRPIAKGTAWEDFVFRVKFSTNPNEASSRSGTTVSSRPWPMGNSASITRR